MASWFAPIKAWFMIFRIMAVVVWSVMTVMVGTACAIQHTGRVSWTNFVLALVTACFAQGFPAHLVNEITDWESGADRFTMPGKKSGGAKVLRARLATIPQLRRMFWVTTVLGLAPVLWLAWRTVPAVLALYAAGYAICVFYTLPPLRLAYRPFAGEWLGGFPGVVLNVIGAYYVQTLTMGSDIVWMAAGTGGMYVGVMLLFHYLDFDADRLARPVKRTTIVFLGLRRSKTYVLVVVAAAAGTLAALALREWIFTVLAAGAVLQWYSHWRCDPRSDVSIVHTGKRITTTLMVSSIAFAAVIRAEFLLMIPVVLLSFFLHRRFGKLTHSVNPKPG